MLRAQRRIERRQTVTVGDDVFHQSVESRRPADDAIADAVASVAAGDDLTDDFVDREAVHLRGAGSGVAGKPALRAAEAGQVAAADARGEEAKQHLTVAERLRRLLRNVGSLKGVRRDEPIRPQRQTSTGMLFQPHWKLDGGRDAASLTIR